MPVNSNPYEGQYHYPIFENHIPDYALAVLRSILSLLMGIDWISLPRKHLKNVSISSLGSALTLLMGISYTKQWISLKLLKDAAVTNRRAEEFLSAEKSAKDRKSCGK